LSLIEQLADWASALRLSDVPDRVVEYAQSQLLSQLAAARAGMAHPLGEAVLKAFGAPFQPDTKQSAYVLAALTGFLHFDDTAYGGHLSNSTATVPLAYAYGMGLDGPALLAAVVAANECAARITAAATLGAFPFRAGGQSATCTHLAGAVAGRLHCQRARAREWVDALGLALAMPMWPLGHGFFGSDAKVLSTSMPVRAGLDACDAAAAGLAGAGDILEHPDGFLARFASVPLPDAVTANLGSCWHTETLSFKMHPAGPGIDAAVDCATELHGQIPGLSADQVAEVVVDTSRYTMAVDRRASAYVDGPCAPVSALVFSAGYTVATALLTGALRPDDLSAPRLDDPQRWALAAKVRLEHDKAMTRDGLVCAVPIGEALRLAGPRAGAWLAETGGQRLVDLVGPIGAPSDTFEDSTKVAGARVTVRLHDGRIFERRTDIPRGAAGPDTRRSHPRLTREKFLATGGHADVADGIASIRTASAGRVAQLLERAMSRA
jgi:2-methylcitrate dehydratase PrpD